MAGLAGVRVLALYGDNPILKTFVRGFWLVTALANLAVSIYMVVQIMSELTPRDSTNGAGTLSSTPRKRDCDT